MSRRPDGAALADSCRHSPARKPTLGGSAAAPAFSKRSRESDPAFAASEMWLARQVEHDNLAERWQMLEGRLARNQRWFKLTSGQRVALPEAAELADIDAQLNSLQALNQTLVATLSTIAATTVDGLAQKLAVAAACVPRDTNEDAHNLVASILSDLRKLTQVIVG